MDIIDFFLTSSPHKDVVFDSGSILLVSDLRSLTVSVSVVGVGTDGIARRGGAGVGAESIQFSFNLNGREEESVKRICFAEAEKDWGGHSEPFLMLIQEQSRGSPQAALRRICLKRPGGTREIAMFVQPSIIRDGDQLVLHFAANELPKLWTVFLSESFLGHALWPSNFRIQNIPY
ncbi:hypothetical protein C8R44DRAFT_734177 [Mycena epipterygia]|nr:hypothetical protein C8R44DRAFT_734177 [Mycena epipterygia]